MSRHIKLILISLISSFCVSKETTESSFFRQITEQKFVELTKVVPLDWLRKYVSMHFFRTNNLNAFKG